MLINQPPPELYAERPVKSEYSSGLSYRTRRIITVSIATLIVTVTAYQLYGQLHLRTPGEIPTIKAEGNYKQRPEQPGGLDIPHQDVDVYKSLDGTQTPKGTVEHLLPSSEVPQPVALVDPTKTSKIIIENQNNSTGQPEKITSLVDENNENQAAGNPVNAEGNTRAVLPLADKSINPVRSENYKIHTEITVSPKVEAAPQALKLVGNEAGSPENAGENRNETPISKGSVKSEEHENAAAVLKSGSVVQLASIADQDAAEKAVVKFQAQYAPALGALHLRLNRADLGDKGIHFRVQTEPVTNVEAIRVCRALKKLNARCLIVH